MPGLVGWSVVSITKADLWRPERRDCARCSHTRRPQDRASCHSVSQFGYTESVDEGSRIGEVRPLDLLACVVSTIAVCVLPVGHILGETAINVFVLVRIEDLGLASVLVLSPLSVWGALGRGKRARFIGAVACLGWLAVFSLLRLLTFPASATGWGLWVACLGPLFMLAGLLPKRREPVDIEQERADRHQATESKWLWVSVIVTLIALFMARSAGLVLSERDDHAFVAAIAVALALSGVFPSPRRLSSWVTFGWTVGAAVLLSATLAPVTGVALVWIAGLGLLFFFGRRAEQRRALRADPLPTYLAWTVDEQGQRIAKRVEARNLADARQTLEAQGLSNIVFERGETAASLVSSAHRQQMNENFTAQQELALGTRSPKGIIVQSVGIHAPFWIPLVMWNGYSLSQGRPFDWIDYAGFFASAAFLVYMFMINAGTVLYDRARHAETWNRWDEALGHLRWLKLLNSFWNRNAILEADFDFREARARAGKGDLAGGLALVERHESGYPRGLYLSRLSTVFAVASDYARELELKRQVAALAEGTVDTKIDLAWTLLFRWHRLDEAARLIEEAEEMELTALARLFLDRAKGALQIERGEAASGIATLREVAKRSAERPEQPHLFPFDAEAAAVMCLGEAANGNQQEATTLLERVEPYLTAVGELDLLRRCRKAAS